MIYMCVGIIYLCVLYVFLIKEEHRKKLYSIPVAK